jgi:PAS domain S-box-containing protein
MKNRAKLQLSSKKQVAFYITLLTVLVSIGGYWYYEREKEQIIVQKEKTLTAISTLKATQLEMWYKEELKDAQVISANPYLEEFTRTFVRSNSPIDKTRLLKLLQQIQLEHDLTEVILTSKEGSIIASTNSQITTIYPDELRSLKNIMQHEKVISTDYFNATQNGYKQSLISFISPLKNRVNNLNYAIILRVDAINNILPLIKNWPTESQTGESFIFSNETNSFLFSSELTHQEEIKAKDKFPFSNDDLLSNIYTSKQSGIYRGKDYRNVDVLASLHSIEGTNWVLISKIDKSELLQELTGESLSIIIRILFLVALSALFIVFWFNTRQKNIYKGLLEKERELRAQQEKFNVVMESIGDGIITLDLNGNIQYLNNRAEELTGWNLREARGRDFHEVYNVINEDTGQKENNILDKVLKKGLAKELGNHTILITKSATEIPVMDTGASIYDASGKVTGIAISFQDETEKRTQSRLIKQSEEKYRILVKNIPQKVFMKNHELSYIYCSENFAEDLGITPGEIAGKTDYDFFSIEMADKYRNDDRFILEKGETITLEEEYQVNGNRYWVRTTKTPIKDENGKITGLLGIFEDFTEKMQAQIALMKSEENLREFFEADLTGDYIATTDGKILYCNPAFIEILGYDTVEEIIDRNTAEFWQNPAEREALLNLIQNQ